ncbi:type VII secretion protein EccCa [Nocardioides antri]|uniref:Type VII secretion protein EccCa n=1 Tax=Nocardioides antri TaxID=2607659 RepID=A0A5B1M8M0_9ACTN|nr:type VII secretion protein EccCa [Nocardioides antri]KAA1428247.1 type VII secretion protein EccCa [Nocardioides antri]
MTPRPEPPTGRIVLDEPPRLPTSDGAGGVAMSALPMLGSLGSVVLVASLGGGSSEVRVVAAGLFLLTTVAYLGIQLDRQRGQRHRQVTTARRAYLRHLAGVRATVHEAAAAQRHALCWLHPDPAALPALAADGSRVGERAPDDPAFLQVRYGVCSQPLSVELSDPAGMAADDADPAAVSAVRRLLETHRRQPDLPAAVDLRRFHRVALTGGPAAGRGLARALVCSVAALHSPEHLVVAVLADDDTVAEWEWVKWLPHAWSADRTDAVGPVRLISTRATELAELLPGTTGGPHVLLVLDGPASAHLLVPPEGRRGLTVLELAAPDEPPTSGVLRFELAGDGRGLEHGVPARAVRLRAEPVAARADHCDTATAEALARRLSARHAPQGSSPKTPSGPADLPTLLGWSGLGGTGAYDPARAWRPRPARDRLRVPIGVGDDGVVHLDLKESAQQGMGPHGLVVGATGSGKSELLRTLVLGLAMTHPPDRLNLVLVDFKGGATFAGMADLPHVAAVITNLAGDLTLVDRMHDALAGEMVRRQELLRSAGNLASVRDHEAARERGADLAPLPSLLVVVDEFSELLAAKPELTELFVAVGRLGRSLGLHLLLASQRLEEGRLRGLDSHLSYRVGLRTFSAQESRTVLGVPDAYALPPVPGLGYLRPDPATLTRFQAAYVSGPVAATVRRGRRRAPLVLPFVARPVSATEPRPEPPPPTGLVDGSDSVLDLAVRAMRGHGPAAHRIWLPPLDRPDPLERLLPAAPGPLQLPVGTLDRPREQRRDPLVLDLRGAGGHVAVVGGPRSGKSTLLRTIISAAALVSSPREAQWYVLDLGGALAPLADVPHVAGLAGRTEGDVVRRIVAEVQDIADRREAGQPDDGRGEIFLCVDGWGTLRAEYDELEPALQQLAQRGLGLGIHLVVSAARWSDFRAALRDQLGTRLELRLGDPIDSEVDRKVAASVPKDRPGRGLVPGPLHFLAAEPPGVEDLVASVTAAWAGTRAPRLRLLPERIPLDVVRREAGADAPGLLLGVDEARLAPVALDPSDEPHLLVFGAGRSGKSTLLRTYLHEVVRTRTPGQAQVVVVDYRRSLLGEVPEDHLLHYLTSADQARPALEELAAYLRSRLPGPDVTPDQLRRRSWWSGAEVFVVVDDYDLVATPQASPVAALQPLLAQAGDVGLRVVVARRSGGAARALFEPVIQSLRDLAIPGVLLSGSREEGPLVGSVRPRPAVPGRAQLVTREGGTQVLQVAWSSSSA